MKKKVLFLMMTLLLAVMLPGVMFAQGRQIFGVREKSSRTPITSTSSIRDFEPLRGNATVILTAGDVWGDGSGYQMLLDADANTYGSAISATAPKLISNCSGNPILYSQFEYKIPENADGSCSTSNIVFRNSVSIQIPAGTYDWCIVNPSPSDRCVYYANNNGNINGRANDYVFEEGLIYEFVVSRYGQSDGVDVTAASIYDLVPELHTLATDGVGNNARDLIDTLIIDRPNGAWMEPYHFQLYNASPDTVEVVYIDFLHNNGYFTLAEDDYPFNPFTSYPFSVANNSIAGAIDLRIVTDTSWVSTDADSSTLAVNTTERSTHLYKIYTHPYTPYCPDVVEKAYVINNGDPFTGTWRKYTNVMWNENNPGVAYELHNNYDLPFDSIPEGYDAVIKFTVDHDVMLDAFVSDGANGKVALYREDFNGRPGPMADNYYIGRPYHTSGEDGIDLAHTDFDFELGSFSETDGFINDTVYPWIVSTDAAYTGSYGMMSGNKGVNDSSSVISIKVRYASSGTVSFDFFASGESDEYSAVHYDKCIFMIDGDTTFIYGEDNIWRNFIDTVAVGDHTFSWIYSKDIIFGSIEDCFKVDNIVFDGGVVIDPTEENPSEEDPTEGGPHEVDGWLYYDNDTMASAIGAGGTPFYWGIMFPASNLTAYDGRPITKVSQYFAASASGDILIYQGGTTAPETLVYSQPFTATIPEETSSLVEFTLTNPVDIDVTQSLWIVMHLTEYASTDYPAGVCEWVGDNNGSWLSLDGEDWFDLGSALGSNYTWMVRAYFDGGATPEPEDPEEPEDPTPDEPGIGTEYSHAAGPRIQGMNVLAGTYYLVASSTDPNFEVTISVDELPCPIAGVTQTYPVDGQECVEKDLTLRWKLDDYCNEYRVVFSTTYWPEDEPEDTVSTPGAPGHPQTIITPWSSDLQESFHVPFMLWNNTNYFWRVEQRHGDSIHGYCTSEGPVFGFTTCFNRPLDLTASVTRMFEYEDTLTLRWNAVIDRTYRTYRIYMDDSLIGTTTLHEIGQNTFRVPSELLTYNLDQEHGYIFEVTAVYDEGESPRSNPFEIYVSGYGTISGTVYEQDGETGIGGATVTVYGHNDFMEEEIYTFITDANGYYEDSIHAGNYHEIPDSTYHQYGDSLYHYNLALATMEGYGQYLFDENGDPVVDEEGHFVIIPDTTIHELPFDMPYHDTVDHVDFILDETFVFPAHVCAQTMYVDGVEGDSLVQVWWDFDFPAITIDTIPSDSLSERVGGTRSLHHYNIYRTDCYNDGPYNSDNTTFLATVWRPDTAYFDVQWPQVPAGVYKYGVSAVYEGNFEGNPNNQRIDYPFEPRESRIVWSNEHPEYDCGMGCIDKDMQTDVTIIVLCNSADSPEGAEVTFTNLNPGEQYNHPQPQIIMPDVDQQPLLLDPFRKGDYAVHIELPGYYYLEDTVSIWGSTELRYVLKEILFPVEDLYVSRTGWAMWKQPEPVAMPEPVTPDNPGPGPQPSTNATIVLNVPAEVWGDGTGYQMLLDADHNTFGTVIPETGGLTDSGDAPAGMYDNFEYKIPTNADGNMNTSNVLVQGTLSITVPAGTYDWCITNPTPGDRIWIASSNGRYDDYVFEAGRTYTFTITLGGDGHDHVGITVSNNTTPPGPGPQPGTDATVVLRVPTEVWGDGTGYQMLLDADHNTFGTVIPENGGLTESGNAPAGMYDNFEYKIPTNADGNMNTSNVLIEGTLSITIPAGIYDWCITNPTPGDRIWIASSNGNIPGRYDDYVFEADRIYTFTITLVSGNDQVNLSITNNTIPDDPTPTDAVFSVSFEGDDYADWSIIDADGDGNNWMILDQIADGLDWNPGHTGVASATSASYTQGAGALTPDNYLVSPQVPLGGTLSFWACAQDPDWAAEKFGVAVSTTGNSSAADFTTLQSWTMTAKGLGSRTTDTRAGGTRMGNWYQYTVDLSAYAGQTGYVAIRHYGCTDMFRLNVDDIVLTAASSGRAVAEERHLEFYKVMCTSINDEPIFNCNTVNPFCQLNTEGLVEGYGFVEGEYYICKVAAVYSTGMSEYVSCTWQYEPCEHWDGTLNGVTADGNTITWDYPAGDQPGPGPQPGDNAMIILNVPTDVWGDGSGYQMLLDADANTFGTVIPETGPLTNSGDAAPGVYDNFEYKIPENADGSCTTSNIVNTNSVSITIPAGTYDWCITNPTPGDRIWIVGGNGNIDGRYDDYVFEAGKTYEFTCTRFGNYDGVNLSIIENGRFIGFSCNRPVVHNGNCRMVEQNTQLEIMTAQVPSTHNIVADNGTSDRDDWLYYDDGTVSNAFGFGGQAIYIGAMFPASTMAAYAGHAVTKVSQYFYDPAAGDILIYQGGTNAPATLLYTQHFNVTPTGEYGELVEFTLSEPVAIDATQSLWIVSHITDYAEDAFPFTVSEWCGDNNGSWLSVDGQQWADFYTAVGGQANGTWVLRAYVEEGFTPIPQPGEGILGAMIFVDGEWEAFVEAPTNTYTYDGPGQEICVRIVYDGPAQLPNNNYYYSMSCEECIGGPEPGSDCEAGDPIFAEVNDFSDQVRIWWGDEPAAPLSEWLYYDDENLETAQLLGLGGNMTWGIMFPASVLQAYNGCTLTEVAVMNGINEDYSIGTGIYTANIYLGGDNAPGTLVSTQAITATGELDWLYGTLDTPVALDMNQNLWIVINQVGIDFPAICTGTSCGNPNARWIQYQGNWYDIAAISDYNVDWFIRGFVTNQRAGGELVALPDNTTVSEGTLSQLTGVSFNDVVFDRNNDRADIISYNIYRSVDNVEYELIANVPANEENWYEYFDTPGAGTFYYKVTAVYEDCESEPAIAGADPEHNYVMVGVTGLDENTANVNIFPNPTKDNVTIQAKGMSRVTVVSVIGQVVYDTKLDQDEYILNMAQFNTGMYVVRVYTESGVAVKRVTVMH